MDKIPERILWLPFIVIGIFLFLIGLMSLNHILNTLWPFDVTYIELVRQTAQGTASAPAILDHADLGVIVAFLAAILATSSGLFLPLIYFLYRRFGKGDTYQYLAIFRQTMWIGIWITFCAWMQMNRSFSVGVAFLSAAVLVIVELLMQLRIRADVIEESETQA